jgi:hypothetical protein
MKQAAFALALAQGGQQHPVRQDIVDTVRAHPAASWEPFDARSNPLALLSASETSQEKEHTATGDLGRKQPPARI